MAENDDRSDGLRGAAEKRVEMKQALSRVEVAAAAPAGDPGWRDKLVEELEGLRVAVFEHVEEVEAPDGLLSELLAAAPRLAHRIEEVRDEHPALCHQITEVIARAKDGAPVREVRSDALDALVALARHRQHGADLVYEGYNVDIGGS